MSVNINEQPCPSHLLHLCINQHVISLKCFNNRRNQERRFFQVAVGIEECSTQEVEDSCRAGTAKGLAEAIVQFIRKVLSVGVVNCDGLASETIHTVHTQCPVFSS